MGYIYDNTLRTDVFKKIVPLAHHHNLRIIRVSNHDYPPSSLFTPSELGDFASPDLKTQAGVLGKLGIEIASLLVYLVDTLKLPPISVSWDSTVVGGISVLGWSLGAYFPVALLGSASALPKGDQELLGKYLRSAILYGMVYLYFSTYSGHDIIKNQIPPFSALEYLLLAVCSSRIVLKGWIGRLWT